MGKQPLLGGEQRRLGRGRGKGKREGEGEREGDVGMGGEAEIREGKGGV